MSESEGLHHFKFLYQRFLASTLGWPEDAQMGYVKLLTVQFERGGIPDDLREIGVISPAAKKHWRRIKPKFKHENADGLLYNAVMDVIRKEAIASYTSSVENGKKGGRPKKPKTKPGGYSGDNPEETGGFPPENPTLNPPGNPTRTNNEEPIQEKNKKESWNQYPGAETQIDILDGEVQNAIEFVFRLKKILLTTDRVLDFWLAFRLNLSGDFYQDRGKLIQHFRNWLKDRDLSEPKEEQKSVRSVIENKTNEILNQFDKR